jgi:hypothetical protein
MTQDPNASAMRRYHDRFDNARYTAIAEFVASNLNADRDDELVVDLLIGIQNAAVELCGHSRHSGAWHLLAVICGQHLLSFHTIDAIRDFLHAFAAEDTRIEDFESTAKAMLRAYIGLDYLKTATAHANGVHPWQGRMAYELLTAVEYLPQASLLLLAHEDDGYIREKLHKGLNRVTSGLYEGIRHSSEPSRYNFKSIYFPDERDC